MRPFEYVEAKNLDHACHLLSEYGERARILAGGQNLLLMLKQRAIQPEYLIDIKRLRELEYLTDHGNEIAMGALTVHRTLETSPLLMKRLPMLVDAEKVLAWVQIRNWGTVAGELCEADPASDLGTVLVALGARIKLKSESGQREIPIESFYQGYMETALKPDEILVEIVVPCLTDHTQGAYVKESVRVGDYGIGSAAAIVTLDGKTIKDVRIASGAAGPTPMRARKAENAVTGRKVGSSFDDVGEAAAAESHPVDDIEGSVEYKRQITKVVTKRALAQAISRAQKA